LRNRGEERGRLEEEGRADGQARVGSERREEGEVEAGPAEERRAGLLGRARRAGPVEKEEGGWGVGLKGRGRKSLRRFSLFFQSFSF
jgi:hypothetical protein